MKFPQLNENNKLFFTKEMKDNLLKDFPLGIDELFYEDENLIHKKVYDSDLIIVIPEGKQFYAWITSYGDYESICLLLEIKQKTIINVNIYSCCSDLHNTIFYGTYFKNEKSGSYSNFFSIEDIFYYKGTNIKNKKFIEKLLIIENIFKKELKQIMYNNNFIVFGLPYITYNKNFSELINNINSILPYNVSKIIYRNYNDTLSTKLYYVTYTKNKNANSYINKDIEVIFNIKPDLQNDIYNLYFYNNDNRKNEFYDLAFIPDYNTSVMMNKLFRNIKENRNLDLLEESDDEEEFENCNIDKFVDLNKSYNMVCIFNNKFKKWVPTKIAKREDRIINKKNLNYIEKNKN